MKRKPVELHRMFAFLGLSLVACQLSAGLETVLRIERVVNDIGVLAGQKTPDGKLIERDTSSVYSRLPGFPGHDAAAGYIWSQLEKIRVRANHDGIPIRTGRQVFTTPTLVDKQFQGDAPAGYTRRLRVTADPSGKQVEPFMLHAVWPNGVTTCAVPETDPLTGPMIYAGKGSFQDMNGRIIGPKPGGVEYTSGYYPGAIVVMEYDSEDNWVKAAALGAQAVIFLEPAEGDTETYERILQKTNTSKHYVTPVEFKRYYVPNPDAQRLRDYLTKNPYSGFGRGKDISSYPAVEIVYKTHWDPWHEVANMWMYIPGIGTESVNPTTHYRDELVILTSFYDSFSVVPTIAPGASQAIGAASLLEFTRFMAENTAPKDKSPIYGNLPKRSILVIFNTAHFNSLQGAREVFRVESDSYRFRKLVQKNRPTQLEAAPDYILMLKDMLNVVAPQNADPAASDFHERWDKLGITAEIRENEDNIELTVSRNKLKEIIKKEFGDFDALPPERKTGKLKPVDYLQSLGELDKEVGGESDEIALSGLFAYGRNNENGSPLFRRGVLLMRRMMAVDRALVIITDENIDAYTDINKKKGISENELAAEIEARNLSIFRGCNKDEIARYIRRLAVETLKDTLAVAETEADRKLSVYRRRDPKAAPSFRASRFAMQLKLETIREQYFRIIRFRLNRLKKYAEMVHGRDDGKGTKSYNAEDLKRLLPEAERCYRDIIRRTRENLLVLRGELCREASRMRSQVELYRILYGLRYAFADDGSITTRLGNEPGSFISINLSPGSKLVGQFFAGGFFGNGNSPAEFYKGNAAEIQSLEAKIESMVARKTAPNFVSTNPNVPSGNIHCVDTFNFSKRSWDSFLPNPTGFDCEIGHMAALRSYAIATVFDTQPYWGYPRDLFSPDFYRPYTAQATNKPRELKFIEHQLLFVGPYLRALIDASFLTNDPRINNPKRAAWTEIYGKCVKRSGKDVNPRTPIPGVLVQGRRNETRKGCVLKTWLTTTNPYGEFTLYGEKRNDIRIMLDGWVVDKDTGEITWSENVAKGTLIGKFLHYSHYCEATSDYVYDITMKMFPARGMAIFELIDPRFMTELTHIQVLDARSDAEPLQWTTPYQFDGEHVRMVFTSPDARPKVIFSEGVFGVRMAMLNVSKNAFETCMAHTDPTDKLSIIGRDGNLRDIDITDVKGEGFNPRTTKIVRYPSLRAAIDFWTLDHLRMYQLRQRQIHNDKIDLLHETTRIYIRNIALKALEDQRYDEFFMATRTAWGTESRAYPDVMATANDTVVGVLFYLFLLIPFCYFLERLLIGSIKIERILVNVAVIFVVMFTLLWMIHPAFDLVGNPFMILLAFIILTLSFVVTAIVYGKFNTEMKMMQQGTVGTQATEVNRSSATFLAITLGINNMRKRKIRTALTCLTVIILTFTALSFTSVVHSVRNTGISRNYSPAYEGIYQRDVKWRAFKSQYLGERYNRILTDIEPAGDGKSVRRVVLYGRPRMEENKKVVWNFSKADAAGAPPREPGFEPLRKAMIFPRVWNLPRSTKDVRRFDLVYEKNLGGDQGIQVKTIQSEHMVGLAADEGWQEYNGEMVYDTMLPKTMPVRSQRYKGDPRRFNLFSSDDALECILPEKLAESLGMELNDFYTVHGKQKQAIKNGVTGAASDIARRKNLSIWIGGKKLVVVGILRSPTNPNRGPLFDYIVDLDNEPITPVNFSGLSRREQDEQKTLKADQAMDVSQAASLSYEHFTVENAVIVPYKIAMAFNCLQRSMSIRWIRPKNGDKSSFGDTVSRTVEDELCKVNKGFRERIKRQKKNREAVSPVMQETDDLLIRMEQNLWIGDKGVAWLYASTGKVGITGWSNLIVPLLISALIILNVMIGAVHERSREIGIFSALGLAPSHIGMLFLAESIVYATIGGMSGYMIGQIIAVVINHFHLLPGLTLNFSSLSTVFVTALVMGSVIASTLYPAMMASRIAVPSSDMRWGVPEPEGNMIRVDLPFIFQQHIISGITLFIYEFFQQHIESSVGTFNVKRVTIETFPTENGTGVRLYFMAWLTPYDLGVSQEVQMLFTPQQAGLFFTEMVFHRVSGDIKDWRRVNLPFLNSMRHQFLVWRTYSPEQRAEYAYKGYLAFQDAFDASEWEPPERPATLEEVAPVGGGGNSAGIEE